MTTNTQAIIGAPGNRLFAHLPTQGNPQAAIPALATAYRDLLRQAERQPKDCFPAYPTLGDLLDFDAPLRGEDDPRYDFAQAFYQGAAPMPTVGLTFASYIEADPEYPEEFGVVSCEPGAPFTPETAPRWAYVPMSGRPSVVGIFAYDADADHGCEYAYRGGGVAGGAGAADGSGDDGAQGGGAGRGVSGGGWGGTPPSHCADTHFVLPYF